MGVEVRSDGPAVVVTMAWPEKRNALGPEDTRQVGDALRQATQDAEVGVILTGEGAFCAGGDLEQFANLSETSSVDDVRGTIYDHVHSVLRAVRDSPVPVIAAVDGPAVGLGFDYALACDMCFVGATGWLQQGWAMAGLIHGAAGSAFLARAAPGAAWRLIAEQSRLSGPAAEALGLAEAVDGSAVMAGVDRFKQLSTLPRAVLEGYTALLRPLRWPPEDYIDLCVEYQGRFIGSEAFRANARRILDARSGPRQTSDRHETRWDRTQD